MFNIWKNVVRIAATLGLGVTRRGSMLHTTPSRPFEDHPPVKPRAERNTPRKRWGSSFWKPNGLQERTRRMRQIAAGTLTRSNGLVTT